VLIETIFSYPGIGNLAIGAVIQRDLPLIQGLVLCFAVLFIAQALGVEMTVAQQIILLLMLMVTSKGIAGVPRASLVVIAATLPTFNMPAEAIGLVLAVDAFMDMGRTATNVVGNSIASAVVAKWEGVLYDPKVDEIAVAETLDNARS
jgi:Na+/H+-dicarboxylate symporter